MIVPTGKMSLWLDSSDFRLKKKYTVLFQGLLQGLGERMYLKTTQNGILPYIAI